MFWLIYLGLAGVMVLSGALLWRRVQHHRQTQGLTLADHTNVAMTILNVVLLLLAVVSMQIALSSYRDTQDTGRKQEESARKQQEALEASRNALVAVLDNLKAQETTLERSRLALQTSAESAVLQQKLLKLALATSQSQLEILDAAWKRELAQPDIRAVLVYPASPAFAVRNESKVKPVRDGLFTFQSLNLNRWNGDRFQLVVTAGFKVDFIPPADGYLPNTMNFILDPNQPLTNGDRLYGYCTVSCADCLAKRLYWFLIEYGVRGWFREVKTTEADQYSLPVLGKLTPSTVETHVKRFLSEPGLVVMPTRLW